MSNKNQTAVEWLNQKLVDRQNGKGIAQSWDSLIQQAKEMEKKQIISFAYKQIENCHNEMGEIMYSKAPEELFNDTYGK